MADQSQQQTLTAAEQAEHAAAVERRAAACMPGPRHQGGRVGQQAEKFRDLLWEIYWRSLPTGSKPPDADGGRAYRPDGIPAGCKDAAQVLAVLSEPGPKGEPPALLVLTGSQLAQDIMAACQWWREHHGWEARPGEEHPGWGGPRDGAGRPRNQDYSSSQEAHAQEGLDRG